MVIFGLCLFSTTVGANSIEYYLIIEDNGNTVVVMTIAGEGLVNIPIDEKAVDINVKGALYRINEDSIDVSIGSTGQAVVVYSTPSLTRKDDNWYFKMDLVDSEMTTAVAAISSNATIVETVPNAFINDQDFKEIVWNENVTDISMEYYFTGGGIIPNPPEESRWYLFAGGAALAVIVGAGAFVYVRRSKQESKMKNRENIMVTLSVNERKIVDIMINHGSNVKRSVLEKESQIAKSSLAGALKNLEKKNIIVLDKTYKSHFIKFTEWFDGL